MRCKRTRLSRDVVTRLWRDIRYGTGVRVSFVIELGLEMPRVRQGTRIFGERVQTALVVQTQSLRLTGADLRQRELVIGRIGTTPDE
jgi:hypothetical protein